MKEDDIIDAMYDYVEMLPKDMQRLYKLYYIDTISHINIGARYGLSGGAISSRLRIVSNKLSELIKREKMKNGAEDVPMNV